MKVKELMSADVKSCSPETNLATVARMMWDGDCGMIPVVDEQRRIIGVITDRDICIAAATRSLHPAGIQVSDAMTRDVTTCYEDADPRTALQALKEHRIRRLPILSQENRLVGVLSMNDLVTRAGGHGTGAHGEDLLGALRAICAHATAGAGARP